MRVQDELERSPEGSSFIPHPSSFGGRRPHGLYFVSDGMRQDLIERYAAEAEHHQMFGVRQDSAVIGFATVEMLNPHVAEIHVIAVRQANHRRGIGRALVGRCVQHCRDAGVALATLYAHHLANGSSARLRSVRYRDLR